MSSVTVRAVPPAPRSAAGPEARRRRMPAPDWPLVAGSALIAILLLSPLWLLAIDLSSAGWTVVHRQLFRSESLILLRNTLLLSATVVGLAAVLGTGAALCTERSALPFRRLWRVLLVVPVAVPDEVSGYAWHTLLPRLDPFIGAALVMTLTTFPFVYLPVAAALRRSDPTMEDTAGSLGASRLGVMAKITLPLVRTAIMGGCVLVALTLFAEYGSFEILGYRTFTTEIFTIFQFSPAAAGALSLPLVVLALLVLAIDVVIPSRRTTQAPHNAPRRRPPGARGPRDHARARRRRRTRCRRPARHDRVLDAAVPAHHPAGGGHARAGHLEHVHLQRAWSVLGRPAVSAGGDDALPALECHPDGAGASHVRHVRGARRRRRSQPRVRHDAICLRPLPDERAADRRLRDHALPAGARMRPDLSGSNLVPARRCRPFAWPRTTSVFIRVTLPLLTPGMLAGFCLVFLMAATELTATLVLAPIGVMTLSTQFWAFESSVAYGAAAPYALVMMVIAVIPAIVLAIWFDRGPHAMPTITP